MSIPSDLNYSKEHEWVRRDGDEVVIGITAFAAEQLGDVVFVELPEAGSVINANDPFGNVESVKSVSELFAPLSGTITSVNEALEDSPESVNDDAYGKGWMIRITPSNPEEMTALLSADQYAELISET
ncbi:MAG: glycine cleavage system protein GcvH [Magnetococcales bacterium]|nr:glycine cleavage system protein GcvH [Magnetococcales bacterium]